MKETKFEKVLEFYREEDYLEELETDAENRYLFFDDEDGMEYPLNNTKKLNIGDFIKDIKKSDCSDCIVKNDYSITNIDKLFNLKKFKKVLSKINPDITIFLNEIVIIIEEDSIPYVEEYCCTMLLDRCVGQSVSLKGSIIINMYEIFNHFREECIDEDEFFHSSIAEFYLTLFHELGHNYARENVLDIEHVLLEKYMTGHNTEEDIVELYARDIFNIIDSSCDVFEPFNRAFIESQF